MKGSSEIWLSIIPSRVLSFIGRGNLKCAFLELIIKLIGRKFLKWGRQE